MDNIFNVFVNENQIMKNVCFHVAIYFSMDSYEEFAFRDKFKWYVFRFSSGDLKSMFITYEDYKEKIPSYSKCDTFLVQRF